MRDENMTTVLLTSLNNDCVNGYPQVTTSMLEMQWVTQTRKEEVLIDACVAVALEPCIAIASSVMPGLHCFVFF
jgi:hypothetical protein